MGFRATLLVIVAVAVVPLAVGYFDGAPAAPAPAVATPAPAPTVASRPTAVPSPAPTSTKPEWVGVMPGDRRWIEAAIARARPEAAALIRRVIGRVTFRTALRPGVNWAGQTSVRGDRYQVVLNQWDVDSPPGRPTRAFVVLHELGHVVDFAEVPDDTFNRLVEEVPEHGPCTRTNRGGCANQLERFADTFAKWALRDPGPPGVGYQLPAPASLDDWGAPLARLAQESPSAGR
jgi:hypothetical protein